MSFSNGLATPSNRPSSPFGMAFDRGGSTPYTWLAMSRTRTTTMITSTTMRKHGGRDGGVFGLEMQ
jgi:hypothetical protein